MTDKAPDLAQARQALSGALARHYPESVLAQVAERHGVLPEATEVAQAALGAAGQEAVALGASALAVLRDRGKPTRGARLVREVILHGWGDAEPGIRAMLQIGLLVLAPAPGQRQWSLDELIERRRYLQRELFCPTAVLDWLEARTPLLENTPPRGFSVSEEGIEAEPDDTARGLWLNLLHLHSTLDGDALALNKDSTPNRRSLLRFALGMRLPEGAIEDAQGLLSPPVAERLYMWLTLSMSLGLLRIERGRLRADLQAGEAFFMAERVERSHSLLRAWRTNSLWREDEALDSAARQSLGERRHLLDRNVGKLAGVRDQLIEDLRALRLGEGWNDLSVVAQTLERLDRGFIAQSLEADTSPERFIRAVLEVSLPWHGWTRLGHTKDGRRVFCWTKRGRHDLSLDDVQPEATPSVGDSPPPLVVQPNMEITVFLKDATLAHLFELYQVGERRALADHVAVFQMDALTVQRAYGRGLNASTLIDFLQKHSRTPLPENVAFALKDWQRVQKKLTLYTTGALLQFPDPDRLDLMADNLAHDSSAGDLGVQRVALEAIYLPDSEGKSLGRVLDLENLHHVDYNSEPPPCLEHLGDLVFAPLKHGLDIVTRAEIERIATRDEDSGHWVWSVEMTRDRWGASATDEVVAFFKPRLRRGVTAALELRLRAVLSEVSATVHHNAMVVRLSDEASVERLLEIHGIEEMVSARLGPCAMVVAAGNEEAMGEVLSKLGLVTSNPNEQVDVE